MARKPMRVQLNSEYVRLFNLPTDHEYVRCAFYLGLPILEIQNRVRVEHHIPERQAVIQTAHLLGILDSDEIRYHGMPKPVLD